MTNYLGRGWSYQTDMLISYLDKSLNYSVVFYKLINKSHKINFFQLRVHSFLQFASASDVQCLGLGTELRFFYGTNRNALVVPNNQLKLQVAINGPSQSVSGHAAVGVCHVDVFRARPFPCLSNLE